MRKSSLLSFFIYLISLLPFWLLYAISDILFIFIYYIFRYRKKVVNENLRHAFPEKTTAERKQIAYRFYRFLPDLIVEVIKMRSIPPSEVVRRIELVNPQEVQRHFDQGKAVIGVTAHYGNWELGIHRLSLMTKNPALIIYKPLSDKTFEQAFNRIRSRFGAIMVPMKLTLRKIIEHRNQPHMSIFVADQSPTYEESDYFTEFLNQETFVYTGVERIARKTNFPVVFCHIDRIRRGYYQCIFTTLAENPSSTVTHEITDIHTAFTEQIICRKPEIWLWSHRRWKRKQKK